jgi:hypothetical protein
MQYDPSDELGSSKANKALHTLTNNDLSSSHFKKCLMRKWLQVPISKFSL